MPHSQPVWLFDLDDTLHRAWSTRSLAEDRGLP